MAVVGKMKEVAAEVRRNRESAYGSPSILQTQLAAQFTSIQRSYHQDDDFPEVPPRLVGLFLACLKMHRIAVPGRKKDRDSYVDLHNYVDFAEEMDDTLPPVELSGVTDNDPDRMNFNPPIASHNVSRKAVKKIRK